MEIAQTTQVVTEVEQGITKVADRVYHGTIRDFVDNGLKVNNKFIDQVGLSVMGKYGMMQVVGQRKPARGKPAAVYSIDFENQTMFSM